MADDDLTSIENYYRQKILSKLDWIIHISIIVAAASWYPQSRVIFGILLMILTGMIALFIVSTILFVFKRAIATSIFSMLKLLSGIYLLISYTFFISLVLDISQIKNFMFSLASNHLCHMAISNNNLCVLSMGYMEYVLNLVNEIGNMAGIQLGL
jgi:uncharacterized membrane protein